MKKLLLNLTLLFLCLISINSKIEANENLIEILLNKINREGELKKMVVVGGDNEPILKSCRKAKDLKIVDSILVGDAKKIKASAARIHTDISDFEIVDIKDPTEMARYSVQLVHDKKADMYAKGSVETKDALTAMLNKKYGLRAGKPINAVSLFYNPISKKLILASDAIIRPYPTLKDKVAIIENCVDVAHALGIENPKVAPLAAIEFVNKKMKETVEGDELTKMNERGEIKDCIVDGPLSLDLAMDPEAARIKGCLDRKIQGDADILVFPDIHTGNIAYKMFTHLLGWHGGNVVTGTTAPAVIPSRSDTDETKLTSIILAVLYSDYLNSKK